MGDEAEWETMLLQVRMDCDSHALSLPRPCISMVGKSDSKLFPAYTSR